jgi:hypothetical protein
LHTDPAPAAHGLDDDGITDAIGVLARQREGAAFFERQRLVEAGHRGHARGFGHMTRLHLVAEGIEHLGRRPDEHDAGLGDGAGERRTFAEQSVAGMHRLCARPFCRRHHGIDLEVALFDRRRPHPHRLVGKRGVHRPLVGVGINGYRADAETTTRAEHAARDLSAVRDEDL